jgi:formyltetrahydrofolate-dependent phosphoribosylglycinamide formyltransferase
MTVLNAKPRPLLPIGVLISGTGRSLTNMIEKIKAGELDCEIRLVVSSTPSAKGLQFAQQAGIPTAVFDRKDFPSHDAYSRAIFDRVRSAGVVLAVLAGFIKRLTIPEDFAHRVVNIHPALIPSFCGKGFYGHHVHESALAYGVKLSGCTVHFVDNEYDHGPVILQMAVPVHDDDTPDTLADRVFAAECQAYPKAIQLIAEGRVRVDGRRVRLDAVAASVPHCH